MWNSRNPRIAVIAAALTLPTLFTWIYFVAMRSFPAAGQQLAYTVGKGIQFSLPVVWVFMTRRNDLRWSTPTRRGLVLGVGFGLLIGLSMWCVYAWGLKPSGFFDVPAEQVRMKVSGPGGEFPSQVCRYRCFLCPLPFAARGILLALVCIS